MYMVQRLVSASATLPQPQQVHVGLEVGSWLVGLYVERKDGETGINLESGEDREGLSTTVSQ